MNIYIDSDVILDLLLKRNNFHKDTQQLFEYSHQNKIKLFTTPVAISNIYYILNDINKRKDSKQLIIKLRKFVEILAMNSFEIDNAAVSKFKDFEDAMQYYSCIKNEIEHIVTRNIKDYKLSDIPVSNTKEIINLLNNKI